MSDTAANRRREWWYTPDTAQWVADWPSVAWSVVRTDRRTWHADGRVTTDVLTIRVEDGADLPPAPKGREWAPIERDGIKLYEARPSPYDT